MKRKTLLWGRQRSPPLLLMTCTSCARSGLAWRPGKARGYVACSPAPSRSVLMGGRGESFA